jgi:hypothetical protein
LIQEEINHLTTYHQRQLNDNKPESLTEPQINRYIGDLEAREAQDLDGSDRCFLGNMRALREFKRDLRVLYDQVRGISSSG